MTNESLDEILRTAKEAVVGLDEPYRSIAFRVLLEKMLSPAQIPSSELPTTNVQPQVKGASTNADVVEVACSRIDRTAHPGISEMKTARDRALFVLRIARDAAGVDKLSASQISSILDRVFRLRATRDAITMALGPETKLVDRKVVASKGGEAFAYRIMAPGEEYLDKLLGGKEK